MTNSKFHQNIEKDLIIFKQLYNQSKNAKKEAIAIRKGHNLIIHTPRNNLATFYKDIINDPNIDYSVKEFLRDMKKLQFRTNDFKEYAIDLIELKKLVNNNTIKRGFFIFTILHFYASNFDCIINFLKPVSKKIKSGKQYAITNSFQKQIRQIKTAEHVELLFKHHDSFFYEYIMKFIDRDLRNSIAHENYSYKNEKIYYKKKWIKVDTLFKKIALMAHFIGELQTIFYKYRIDINQTILDQNIKKKDLLQLHKNFIV
ncbi:MAG: hypothetical protein ACLFPJ_06145 [Candidatus Woesearchaeota archaeon]